MMDSAGATGGDGIPVSDNRDAVTATTASVAPVRSELLYLLYM